MIDITPPEPPLLFSVIYIYRHSHSYLHNRSLSSNIQHPPSSLLPINFFLYPPSLRNLHQLWERGDACLRRCRAMMSVKDDWMRAAMADDKVVVELLVRLKQAHAVAPVKDVLFPPTKWGVRQPRSRMAMRFDAFTLQKDAAESTRNSPTTPLSWNASAASLSCTADGFEESTFRCAFTARSKSKVPSLSISLYTVHIYVSGRC